MKKKVSSLALAVALALGAMAPAAMAGKPACTGKEFGKIMSETAKDKSLHGTEKRPAALATCTDDGGDDGGGGGGFFG